MKKLYLLSILVFSVCMVKAEIIYVKAGSNGNGTSWDRAYGDLQAALNAARPGDQIWVAAGTYRPTNSNDRLVSFHVRDGIQLYGGFAGHETLIDQRVLGNFETILSGEIGAPGQDDNSYTVVYTKGVSASTVIDGFVITGGAANGAGEKGDMKRCGAGWYNDGSNGASNPVIQNCVFRNNFAFDGAGIYNLARNGEASPFITNCIFAANQAELDGGAIFNDAAQGTCNPLIQGCSFQENQASYGAGVMNQSVQGQVRPTIRNCQFLGNISLIRGSGVYNNRLENGICAPIVQSCVFEDNNASVNKQRYNAGLIANEKNADIASDKGYRK